VYLMVRSAAVSLAIVVLVGHCRPAASQISQNMARAAAYDGPGSLPPAIRKQVQASFDKTYAAYHGSLDGAEALQNLARREPFPAPALTIQSKADIARAEIEKLDELKRTNPQLALWKMVKDALAGAQGQAYFDEHMKDIELPEFKGRVVAARPESAPKELVLAVEDGKMPDATLQLAAPLTGKVEPGTELGFKGVAKTFTTSPFNVTFAVERGKLTGLNTVAPAKAKPGAGRRIPLKK
jgi:hypothetical protein